MIKRRGQEWVLYTRDGSRVLGRHSSPEGARRQETAILARRRVSQMKKQADVTSVQIPSGLLYEAISGEPAALADIKRLEEAQARRVFSGSSRAVPSLLGRALLGRTRSPGAALTSREEKLIEQYPQLRQLSAGANPEKTYWVSRALTHPGLVAIPTAGLGALTARLVAQALGAEGAARELATAGGAALGGLIGSVGAHAMRQRHARRISQYMQANESGAKVEPPQTMKSASKNQGGFRSAPIADEVLTAVRILDTMEPKERKALEKAFGPRAADIRKGHWWKIGSLEGSLPYFLDSLEKLAIAARPLAGGAEGAAKTIAKALGLGQRQLLPL